MAITRAQIPEQIDIFQEGGGVENEENNDENQEKNLSEQLESFLKIQLGSSDYDADVQKYAERLRGQQPARRKFNIYDFASELGAGLLSTPNTGMGSTYIGLGVGFKNASDRMRAIKADADEENREIARIAAQMALQDERSALEFTREEYLKTLDNKNKKVDYLYFKMPDGKIQQVKNIVANEDKVESILANGGQPTSISGTNINIGGDGSGVPKEREKLFVGREEKLLNDAGEKYKAGTNTLVEINSARRAAENIGDEEFGLLSNTLLPFQKLLSSLNLTTDEQERILADKILITQLGMNFTMNIVSRTKGAISNREMELFIMASPGLGSSAEGFRRQLAFLEKIAQRDVDFYTDLQVETDKLEKQLANDEISYTQYVRGLEKFEVDWYNKTVTDEENDNKIFSDDDIKFLESTIQDYYEGDNPVAGLDTEEDRQRYIEGFYKALESGQSVEEYNYLFEVSRAQSEYNRLAEEYKTMKDSASRKRAREIHKKFKEKYADVPNFQFNSIFDLAPEELE